MPDERKNVAFDIYRLRESDDIVKLTLTIGFGQEGSTTVKLNNKIVGTFDESFSLDLGSNNKLHTKELRITCLVQDVQPDRDIVSAHAVLTGGAQLKDWTLLEEPTKDNETYPLRFTIGLFK